MAYVAWLIRSESVGVAHDHRSHDHREEKMEYSTHDHRSHDHREDQLEYSPPRGRSHPVFVEPNFVHQTFNVRQPVSLEIIINDQTIGLHDFEAELIDPEGVSHVIQPRRTAKGALIAFNPDEPGQYQVNYVLYYCFISYVLAKYFAGGKQSAK